MDIEGADLIFDILDIPSGSLDMAQNTPNPFSDFTSIAVQSPNEREVVFSIQDVSGRVILQREMTIDKGYNEINLSKDELPGGGVLIYSIASGEERISKKMMIIER